MDKHIPVIGVCNHEPYYKKLSKCKTKQITVTISSDDDTKIAKINGVAALRRHRLKRICKESEEQEALLSFEQLANILTASVKTISRDIKYIYATDGTFLKTRKYNINPVDE